MCGVRAGNNIVMKATLLLLSCLECFTVVSLSTLGKDPCQKALQFVYCVFKFVSHTNRFKRSSHCFGQITIMIKVVVMSIVFFVLRTNLPTNTSVFLTQALDQCWILKRQFSEKFYYTGLSNFVLWFNAW